MSDQSFSLDQLAPAPAHAPARRRRTWPVYAGIAAALLTGVVALVVVLNRGGGFTVSGTMTLQMAGLADTNLRSDGIACDGTSKAAGGGYSDVATGVQVVISDSAGKTVAVGRLGSGATKGRFCVMPFTIANVPAGKGFYGVEVSHRGRLQYPEADLRHGLALTLG
jgi:hypothetical protein